MTLDLLPEDIRDKYEVHEWKHACAVLSSDFPEQWEDTIEVLRAFHLRRTDVVARGGGLSPVSRWFDREFVAHGWIQKGFETAIVVDAERKDTPTHKVDCVKGPVALEIEWSNKDPFYDRDLNNFRLLFDLRAISVGVIITKSDELRGTFESLGVWSKFGTSTTWMGKLIPRIDGGGGGGCPVLVFGIGNAAYVED